MYIKAVPPQYPLACSRPNKWGPQVLEDVRVIIAEQLGTDLGKVTPESKFVDLGADSLDTVEIMMALEEKFELQLDEEGAEKISTVQARRLLGSPPLTSTVAAQPLDFLKPAV